MCDFCSYSFIHSFIYSFPWRGAQLGSPGMHSVMSPTPSSLWLLIFKGLSSSKEVKEKNCTKVLPFEATERNLLQHLLCCFLFHWISYGGRNETLPVVARASLRADCVECGFCSHVWSAHGFLDVCPCYSKCGPGISRTTGQPESQQIHKQHPKLTGLESLWLEPRNLCLTSSPGDFDSYVFRSSGVLRTL